MADFICEGIGWLILGGLAWLVKHWRDLVKHWRDLVKPANWDKRFVLVSIILALPFIACGSWLWTEGVSEDSPTLRSDAYFFGDLVYWLGMPLTLIVLFCGYARGLSSSDHWWAIPLIDFLFVLQWVIWGQLLALGVRISRPKID